MLSSFCSSISFGFQFCGLIISAFMDLVFNRMELFARKLHFHCSRLVIHCPPFQSLVLVPYCLFSFVLNPFYSFSNTMSNNHRIQRQLFVFLHWPSTIFLSKAFLRCLSAFQIKLDRFGLLPWLLCSFFLHSAFLTTIFHTRLTR